jgi:RNA polymerase sigma factor (sigma-70 family)
MLTAGAGAMPFLALDEVDALVARWKVNRDRRAADRLVRAYASFIRRIAREYRWSREDPADLVQEGRLGFLDALDGFDPGRGHRLATYAAYAVRSRILRTALAGRRRAARNERLDLADVMPLPDDVRPDRQLEAAEERTRARALVDAFAGELDGRDRLIFERRCRRGDDGVTLAELAVELALTGERVRQLEADLLSRLRRYVTRRRPARRRSAPPRP